MSKKDPKWSLSGDCVEACTSPTVCPYYWGSPAPSDLHGGKDQCEGAFTFRINEGHNGEEELNGLLAGYGFNTGIGGPGSKDPWKCILYIDARATEVQGEKLEEIFRTCWNLAGQVLKVKKIQMLFLKKQMGTNSTNGYRHEVRWEGIYSLRAEPLRARDGTARYISGQTNGHIYVGRSLENSFNDSDLPRGRWDSPGMSNTYFNFYVDPDNQDWVP
jgi:hypothetical protein